MQVKEIYENALALNIGRAEDDEEMAYFGVKMFNILLSETKCYNDCIRIKKGKERLEKVPFITQLTDEMPYEEELYAPFSYGLASKLLAAQEETTLASLYNNQYVSLLNLATPYILMEE